MQAFQNGPNRGRDVFVPLDALIGGEERAGHGWQMLMSALAAGRGISLPSLSAAAAALGAHATGMYARVREQFGLPVGRFEGVREKLANLAGNAYLVEAARRLTCAALNQGVKPAVVSGIMKYHATERMRQSVNDAMDVHAGRGVIDGPRNYLGSLYRAVPIAITVEGANILTRNLIIFGQGAIRAHPYLMPEMLALGNPDEERGMEVFHDVFWRHLRHVGMTSCAPSGGPGPAACWRPRPHRGRRPATTAGWAATPPASRCWPTPRWPAWAARSSAASCSRKIGRHSVRAVSVVGRAQALGRRRPQARRPAAGALVHGAGRGSHRGAMDRCCPTCRAGCWPGACAPPSCRCGSPRGGRRLDARMRRAVAQALAHA